MIRPIVLPEIVVPGKRLGRHVRHDPRSLRYLSPAAPAVSVEWERHIPILDQGNVGSCTGNATVGALGSGELIHALAPLLSSGLVLDERLAVAIYSDAETLDGDGPYPPNDNGSTGLSVAQVAKTRGYVSGYTHATSIDEAHGAIQAGPVMIGSNWYSGFDTPDGEGIVRLAGTLRGGHEYVCRGYDAARDLWHLDNSWGTSYGVAGSFFYDSHTFGTLLARHGDVTALVPLDAPAPVPSPALTRTFTAPDVALIDDWAAYPHVWRKASKAAAAWKRGT